MNMLQKELSGCSEERLRSLGFLHTQTAQKNISLLQEIFQNKAHPESVHLIVSSASRSFDADEALNGFERFLQSRLRLPGFQDFCTLLFADEENVERFCKLFSGSLSLSALMISQPETGDWLLSFPFHEPRLKSEMMQETEDIPAAGSTIDEKFSSLRKRKNKELVRIGMRDLCRDSDFAESVESLSDLADVCLHRACEIVYRELVRKFGKPMENGKTGEKCESRYCVVGLGKLGGRELNFSSDIDIVFVYSSTEGETTGVPLGNTVTGKLSNREFFCNFARLVTAKVGEVAPDGLLYRVDLRLRPGGRSSDLAASTEMYESYYESWGETWERQMLIKARICAGDKTLGKEWMRMVRPFIFRKHLDYQAIAEIRAVKERINKSLFEKRTHQDNVKLGYGGIREVEFIVQVFQLIYGGKFPWLKERNSLRAIHRIAEKEFVSSEEYANLIRALIFLRELENRIQMTQGLQTYTIPKDDHQRLVLARKMDLGHYQNPIQELFKRYQEETGHVRAIYDTLFYDEKMKDEEPDTWDFHDIYAEDHISYLKNDLGFHHPEELYKTLRHIHDGRNAQGRETPRCKRLYRKLIPSLLEVIRSFYDPLKALKQFDGFLAGWSNRESLYDFLLQNRPVLENLLLLLSRSLYFAKLIQREPEAFYDIRAVENIQEAIQKERETTELFTLTEGRRIKQVSELLCGLKYTRDLNYDPGADLSSYADSFLHDTYKLCREETGTFRKKGEKEPAFAIFALGKLGGQELDFGSDLDLIFVYDDRDTLPEEKGPLHEYFVKLQGKIQAGLSATGKYGSAYKLDLRLRPYGKVGQPVDPLSRYHAYFREEGENWERLAYTKLRFCAGDESLKEPFMKEVTQFLFEVSPKEAFLQELRKQMLSMRKRMERERGRENQRIKDVKLGYGGVADIDFCIQYLTLCYGTDDKGIRFLPPLRVLSYASQKKYISLCVAEELTKAYLFYRRLIRELRLESDNDTTKLPLDRKEFLTLMASRCGFKNSESFLEEYKRITAQTRRHMQALLA